jgi:hypothetical protein
VASGLTIDLVSLDQRVRRLEKQRDMLIAACVSLSRYLTKLSQQGADDVSGTFLEVQTADVDLNVWLQGLS